MASRSLSASLQPMTSPAVSAGGCYAPPEYPLPPSRPQTRTGPGQGTLRTTRGLTYPLQSLLRHDEWCQSGSLRERNYRSKPFIHAHSGRCAWNSLAHQYTMLLLLSSSPVQRPSDSLMWPPSFRQPLVRPPGSCSQTLPSGTSDA